MSVTADVFQAPIGWFEALAPRNIPPCWSLLTCSRPQWTGWRHQNQRFGTHRQWTAGLVQDNCRIQHRLHVRHSWCVPGTNRLVWGISSTEYPAMLVSADMFQAPMDWLKASAPKNMVLALDQSIKIWDTWSGSRQLQNTAVTPCHTTSTPCPSLLMCSRHQSVGLRH